MQRVGIKTHRTESGYVTGPGKLTVCRRVHALFSRLGNFTGLGSEGVNKEKTSKAGSAGCWAASYNTKNTVGLTHHSSGAV